MPFWPIWDNERAVTFALLTRKRDLIRIRNRSKLIQGSLYVIIGLLIRAKSITLYLIWRVGGCFPKKILIYFITFNFSCSCCSIDLKRQSEHSELRPNTSSFVFILLPHTLCKTQNVCLASRIVLIGQKF